MLLNFRFIKLLKKTSLSEFRKAGFYLNKIISNRMLFIHTKINLPVEGKCVPNTPI
jgi:hypothetical protein